MDGNILVLVGLIMVIGVISVLITYFRADQMASAADLTNKGLPAVRRGNILFFGLFLPVVVGVISYYIYQFMLGRWPENAQTWFLLLAIAIAIVFSVMAAVVFKMRGFWEWLALHIVYLIGFGWLMPVLLTP